MDKYEPAGINLPVTWRGTRPCRFVTEGPYIGWIVYQHLDGQWVTLHDLNPGLRKINEIAMREYTTSIEGSNSAQPVSTLDLLDQAQAEHRKLESQLTAERAKVEELTKALLYIGDKAVVDWDDPTVGEADAATNDAPKTYKESYVAFMRHANDLQRLYNKERAKVEALVELVRSEIISHKCAADNTSAGALEHELARIMGAEETK